MKPITDSPCFQRLLGALQRAIDAHGAPNRFGLSELEVHHHGPACGAVGRLGSRWPAEGIPTQLQFGIGHERYRYRPFVLYFERERGSPSFIRVVERAEENPS